MARKIIILISAVFIMFAGLFAENQAPKPVTQSAEETVNVKMKEVHITLAPTLKLVLPDTSLKINLKQDLGPTTVEADSEYNYLYSKINYMLKYTLNADYPPAVSLYDDVRFEQIYDKKKYLQRGRGFSLSLNTPYYLDALSFREEIRRDTYYFASLENDFTRTDGNMIILDTYMHIQPGKSADNKSLCICTSLEKAIPYQGSPYGFILLNLSVNSSVEPAERITFSNLFEYGYLLLRDNLPLWKSYNLGGYERMAGYKVDSMTGNYKVFYRGKVQWMALPDINFKIWLIDFLAAGVYFNTDIGAAGDVWDIQRADKYKMSAGTGIDLYFAYRKTTKLKLTLAIAQAIEQGSAPIFYLIQEL